MRCRYFKTSTKNNFNKYRRFKFTSYRSLFSLETIITSIMTDKPCICTWKDCETLHLNIRQITPASHVWNQPIIRLQFPKSDPQSLSLKKYALQQSILRNLLLDKSRLSSYKHIFIAPHHFPISLLEWRSRNGINTFTKYLSPADLGNMGCNDNIFERFCEYANSVAMFLRSHDSTTSIRNIPNVTYNHPLKLGLWSSCS